MLNDSVRNAIALKRFSLISPVINRQVDNNMQYYIRVTKEPIEMPYYGMRRYSPKTLESWYCDYLKKGIDGLKPSSRGDKGKYRVIPEQLSEKIIDMRIKYPKAPGSVIYEMLLKDRVFEHNDISMSSFYRFLRTIPQQIKEKDAEVAELKRFSHQYINELWQTDLAYGPYIYNGNKRKATYLLAIIDDAARFVPHAQFYFSQGFESLRHLFKEAVMKKGVPTLLYTDNGRIYRSQQFEYICASIGCTLIHAKPFAANSKGKIERFFLSVRQRFLSRIETDKIKDIDELNRKFWAWLDTEYHKKPHSSLDGVTPLEYYMSQIDRVKLIENPEILTEKFFYRVKRKIKHDATFTIDKILFETDPKFASCEMEVRYEPEWLDQEGKNVLIFKDDKKVGEARQVNFHENAHVKRKGSKSISFPKDEIPLEFKESEKSFQTISFVDMEDEVKNV
ncbi:MAG TPA: DDE-type integrase/transposase/recombinase [Pseudobacteroides sp.]|nr:transposase [Clostridium sp.]HOV25683.1 DDE-type integrase/transposase/recombinase [Pseudobacteroides sp.]